MLKSTNPQHHHMLGISPNLHVILLSLQLLGISTNLHVILLSLQLFDQSVSCSPVRPRLSANLHTRGTYAQAITSTTCILAEKGIVKMYGQAV